MIREFILIYMTPKNKISLNAATFVKQNVLSTDAQSAQSSTKRDGVDNIII